MLAGWDPSQDSTWLSGWQWGRVVQKAEARDWYKNGVIQHKVLLQDLRKMAELKARQRDDE